MVGEGGLATLGGVAGWGEEDDGVLVRASDGVTLGSLAGELGAVIRATGARVAEGRGVSGVAK